MFRLTDATIAQLMGGPIDWAAANDAQKALLASAVMEAVEARYGRKALLDCILLAGGSTPDFLEAHRLLTDFNSMGYTDKRLIKEAAG